MLSSLSRVGRPRELRPRLPRPCFRSLHHVSRRLCTFAAHPIAVRAAADTKLALLSLVAHPKTHLTGSLDLLSHLSLLPSYDTYVRPWFRNPKPPVALPAGTGTVAGLEVTTALTSEEKGKGKATDGGAGGKAGGGGTGGGTGGAAVHAQQGKKKDTVVDLKRMKGDFDDLVEECVVIRESVRGGGLPRAGCVERPSELTVELMCPST